MLIALFPEDEYLEEQFIKSYKRPLGIVWAGESAASEKSDGNIFDGGTIKLRQVLTSEERVD